VRTAPIRHGFTYRTYLWLVDLDDMPEVPMPLRCLARFQAQDHVGDPAATLRANLDRFLASHGVDLDGGRVLMLAHPRVFGYVFNPLTLFWCRYPDGSPAGVVAEVHNTYGGRHRYLLAPGDGGRVGKDFYVSPFFPVDGAYQMRLPEPAERLDITVNLRRGGTGQFMARLQGDRHPLTAATLVRMALRYPWVTAAVSARIRLQGSYLFLRGLPVYPRPDTDREHHLTQPERTAMTISPSRAVPDTADPRGWPDVAGVPRHRAPLRIALLAVGVDPGARRLGVRVGLPDGRVLGSPDPRSPVMEVHQPEALYRRVIGAGLIGFGESYQAGEWDADDLPGLLRAMAHRALTPPRSMRLLRRAYRRPPTGEAATVTGARRNAQRHYDLSNDLFRLFLDETMTYSSALFESDESGCPIATASRLADAQRRKIDRVLDLAGVKAGTRLLEIGTGWGELAIQAARRGALVHTVTLSAAQYDLARDRVAAAGVADRVIVKLCDYRAVRPAREGGYHAVVSVEMIEAVEERYWPAFFRTLDQHLASGGRAVLQAITMRHAHLMVARGSHTWIHKYIFPGGLIPSIRAIDEVCQRHTQLRIHDVRAFGPHYTQTLRLWRERFQEHAADVSALGFDETFYRTWRLYLSYAEAGFDSGYLNVHHLVLERPHD
jgi:cyclopropane fatty-acyl-phospholipid synthase-like methyltransferase/DUF1365 family protein